MEDLWEALYPDELTHISTQTLKEEQPYNSAHVTFTGPQLVWIVALLIAFGAALVLDWKLALVAANCVIQSLYFLMTCFKCYILFKGANPDNQLRFTDEEIDAMDEATLPVYTILVPMYREANILPKLIANLEKLDYPKFKLDIRLLLEEDDTEAIELVKRLDLPPYYSMVVVPHSLPKTKPKACNYGLIHARGEYVVIYDAEDRPDRRQLKKAVAAFRSLPDDYACVQAKLNYFNSTQNLLTRWFTQEFNSLNTISYFIVRDGQKAKELLNRFAGYLRSSIDFKNMEAYILLRKELEFVDAYLHIEKARFGDRLKTVISVQEEALNSPIPPLILQPIVENAVLHGIMKKVEGGTVELSVTLDGNALTFTIRDDGVGMNEAQLGKLFADRGGKEEERSVGLRNIHSRLEKLYGSGLRVHSAEGTGTTVTFSIPA